MKVVAKRGVCIGVDKHLVLDEEADMDDATAHFLMSIGAVGPAAEAKPADAPAVSDADDDSKKPKAEKSAKKGT